MSRVIFLFFPLNTIYFEPLKKLFLVIHIDIHIKYITINYPQDVDNMWILIFFIWITMYKTCE